MTETEPRDVSEPYASALTRLFQNPRDPHRKIDLEQLKEDALLCWFQGGTFFPRTPTPLFPLEMGSSEIEDGLSFLSYLMTNKAPIGAKERWLLNREILPRLSDQERFELFSAVMGIIEEAPLRVEEDTESADAFTIELDELGLTTSPMRHPYNFAGFDEVLQNLTHVLNHYSIQRDEVYGARYTARAEQVWQQIVGSIAHYEILEEEGVHIFDTDLPQMFEDLRLYSFHWFYDHLASDPEKPFNAMAFAVAKKAHELMILSKDNFFGGDLQLLPWSIAYEVWTGNEAPSSYRIAIDNHSKRTPPAGLDETDRLTWQADHDFDLDLLTAAPYEADELIRKFWPLDQGPQLASGDDLLTQMMTKRLGSGPSQAG